MPNWVQNVLIVDGETDDIMNFARRAEALIAGLNAYEIGELVNSDDAQRIADALGHEDSTLTFFGHVPQPGDPGDVLDWRTAHWGCKWDADSVERLWIVGAEETACSIAAAIGHHIPPRAVVYRFSTPWRAPFEWLENTCGQHRELRFKLLWNEEQGYAGVVECADGTLDADDCHPRDLLEHGWDCPHNPDYFD